MAPLNNFNHALLRIHQMFSPVCSTKFSQFEQLKKQTSNGPKHFFFLILPVEKEIIVASGDYISAAQLMLIAHSLSRPILV